MSAGVVGGMDNILTWKPMKDGYGRTTGYVAHLADGRRAFARNTGGRRSTGTWIVEVASSKPGESFDGFRARGGSLRSVKESAERFNANLDAGGN